MRLAERRWQLGLVLGVAAVVTTLSVVEGSLLGGLLLSLGVLLVAAGLLIGIGLLLRTPRRRAAAETPETDDTDVPHGRFDRMLHVVRSRPWNAGAGVVAAATAALHGRAGTLVSPRGERLAAPHLVLEFNPDDLAAATERWPAQLLAEEYAAGYAEHAKKTGLRRVAAQTVVAIAADQRLPVGRVIVTPSFAPNTHITPVATAAVDNGPEPPRPEDQPSDDSATIVNLVAAGQAEPDRTAVRQAIASVGAEPTAMEPVAPAYAEPTGSIAPEEPARLVALDHHGAVLELTKLSLELGRTHDDGPLGHDVISRRHARLVRAADGWSVDDLGSTNGVYVNGARVERRRTLSDGDTIRLGATGPRFRLDVPAAGEESGDEAAPAAAGEPRTALTAQLTAMAA